MERIYADDASATPLYPEVTVAMQDAAALAWGTASALEYREGRAAAHLLERARQEVAALINARPEEVYFTSNGTEANNWAVKGLAATQPDKRHLVIPAIEHISVLNAVKRLTQFGTMRSTLVPVNAQGLVEPAAVEAALTGETALVSVQLANNELGTIQPVAELAARAKRQGLLIHADAVAAAGRIPVDVRQLGVDALSVAANQFGGPSGVGALYIREGVRIQPLFDGGTQEQGRRAGGENLVGIVGAGAAAARAGRDVVTERQRRRVLGDRLLNGLQERIDGAHATGPTLQARRAGPWGPASASEQGGAERLPGHVSLWVDGVEDSEALLRALDLAGIAASNGSACSSKAMKTSHVLKAVGLTEAQAEGAVIFSLGWATTEQDVDGLLERVPKVVAQLRQVLAK